MLYYDIICTYSLGNQNVKPKRLCHTSHYKYPKINCSGFSKTSETFASESSENCKYFYLGTTSIKYINSVIII